MSCDGWQIVDGIGATDRARQPWVAVFRLYDDEDRWTTSWLRYARHLTGKEKPDWEDDTEVWTWIDDVCRAFSNQFTLLTRLVAEG